MVNIAEHKKKILDVKQQLSQTQSPKRRCDLTKYLQRLNRELAECQGYLKNKS